MESPKLSSISDSESSIPRIIHLQEDENGPPAGKTSIFWAIFLVVNAALGAGLLAFPLSFYMTGGVVVGVVIELVRLSLGLLVTENISFEGTIFNIHCC